MKLKQEVTKEQLIDLGFRKPFRDLSKRKKYECHISNEADNILFKYDWFYPLGHSRRGQHYYLLLDTEKNLTVTATEPDGTGGPCSIDDIFSRLYKLDLIEQ